MSTFAVLDTPSPAELERIAADTTREAAALIASRFGRAVSVGTKSSSTDVVTQTDIDTEALIRKLLAKAVPGSGAIGEEAESTGVRERVQWVIDPLDGTVNYLYSVPIFAVSIAAAVDGEFVAGAVVDVLRGEVFSAHAGGGARLGGTPLSTSSCASLDAALIATGFSYTPKLRLAQGDIVRSLLPKARDIRCFGSAALQLCWLAAGRIDGYFERDIKLWDWAAGALIAEETGATVELPCPENDGLVMAATPLIFGSLRSFVAPPPDRLDRTKKVIDERTENR
jgi:myo-inositol-1(or 4)-monophosphatase